MANSFQNGYALLIGVGRDLVQTRNDAEALRALLTNAHRAGYPPGQVALLTDKTTPPADRQSILQALDDLKQKTANNPDATVFIFYSGHGHEFVVNGAPVGYYLLPLDYDLKDLDHTAISGKIFTDKLKGIQAKKQIVFLDCCFAAAIPKTKDEVVESTPQNMPPELMALNLGSGQVVVASCDQREQSVTDKEHSVFTRALLEALDGSAYSSDGYARFLYVLSYLLDQVPLKAAQYKVTQSVVLKAATDLKDNFALCRIPGGGRAVQADDRNSYLYKMLLPINFTKEQLNFTKLRKTAYANAYLISGGLWYGHYWLVRRLLDELHKEGVMRYPPLNMASRTYRADVNSVWDDLSRYLEMSDSPHEKEEVIEVMAAALANHPIALVLDNVECMAEDGPARLFQEFWGPLAEGVCARLRGTGGYRLYLFLLYADEPGKPWPGPVPQGAGQVGPPYYLQRFELAPLAEETLYAWMKDEAVTELLVQKGCLPAASEDVEPLSTALWQQGENGIPEKVADQFFKLLKAKYKVGDQWLYL